MQTGTTLNIEQYINDCINEYKDSESGNGFLYNMVRIIAGTLIDVGTKKIMPIQIQNIINSKDRSMAGKTLPPNGLYLVKVEYE